jgi:trk system potassium uptake protein TrkH
MFIGASPGSVGGGVKTTTFSIYVIMVMSYLRGKQHVEAFGRAIPARITSKAVATITMAFTLVVVSTTMLLVLQERPNRAEENRYFLNWLFEAVSAFGTVGLSTGVTPDLTTGGKLIIILTMFAGRLGPLGLAISLFGREIEQRYKYPEENVMIG